MPEHEPEISILDQRLAEIDRRLSRIQVGLTEEVGADAPSGRAIALAPPLVSGETGGRGDSGEGDEDDAGLVAAELRGLVSDQAQLLDRLAELITAGERLVAGQRPPAEPPPAATAAGALTVTAGPFASLDAVRAFERTLSALPGVASAEVRGYEGGDRAVVDVHLNRATS